MKVILKLAATAGYSTLQLVLVLTVSGCSLLSYNIADLNIQSSVQMQFVIIAQL